MLLALLACVTDPPPELRAASPAPEAPRALPESDLPFAGTGRWELDGHVLTLAHGTIRADGDIVIEGVYDDPVLGPDALWVPADRGDGDGGIYALRPESNTITMTTLLSGGRPDRLTLAPDGGTLVYVAGTTGITSLWRTPTSHAAPRQLTNVGVARPTVPGTAPAGFVPPPVGTLPRFSGDRLVWTAGGAEREVAWR